MVIEDGSRLQRIRLFRNERLESLTLFTPQAFLLTWSMVLALALYASWNVATFVNSVGLVLLGGVLWTLFEYVMHRFVFHLKLKAKFAQSLAFLMHGNHHADPDDRFRNIMPPIVSIGLLGACWCVFILLAGSSGSVIFLGFAIGYVIYDSVHYACHQYAMRSPLLRQLRSHHIRHHYAKQEGNYAITAIFWDRVFGTAVPTKDR